VRPSEAPRPPSYAWHWLQRSRPVLSALATRLTGRAPDQGFVDEVRAAFDEDPFVQAVVLDTVAEVAFAGRVPHHRPAGVMWDRGLSWWAATLAGTSLREFESPPEGGRVRQPDLFGPPEGVAAETPAPAGTDRRSRTSEGAPRTATAATDSGRRPSAAVTLERRRLAEALRRLLGESVGGDVPAGAVRQLIHDLETLD
jgi:hypothetical protein